jgi:hypothetical protein
MAFELSQMIALRAETIMLRNTARHCAESNAEVRRTPHCRGYQVSTCPEDFHISTRCPHCRVIFRCSSLSAGICPRLPSGGYGWRELLCLLRYRGNHKHCPLRYVCRLLPPALSHEWTSRKVQGQEVDLRWMPRYAERCCPDSCRSQWKCTGRSTYGRLQMEHRLVFRVPADCKQ